MLLSSLYINYIQIKFRYNDKNSIQKVTRQRANSSIRCTFNGESFAPPFSYLKILSTFVFIKWFKSSNWIESQNQSLFQTNIKMISCKKLKTISKIKTPTYIWHLYVWLSIGNLWLLLIVLATFFIWLTKKEISFKIF